jgi:3-vinyl bacteriochlorophyllide hydratase
MQKPGYRTDRKALYTPEQRQRRDASKWTLVQGFLAAFQFLVFLVSLGFVLRALLTGEGVFAAHVSVIFKTVVLYTIMVTGSLWEKDVFGQYLFAPAFFWEDAVSFVVIALHTAYIVSLWTGALDATGLLLLVLAAYAVYAVNAAQFLWKFKHARAENPARIEAGVRA